MEEVYRKQMAKMDRPIPGMSLTNDPENPAPFEGAPEFTNKKAALEEVFGLLIEPERYEKVIEALADGTPVMSMTEVILYEGFRLGKWNPDLFVLLIEPTMYMIMALAERVGVDYRVDYEDEDEDLDMQELNNKFQKLKGKVVKGKVGSLPKEIEEKIANLPADSLLSRTIPAEVEEEEQESMFKRPQ